MLPFEGQSSRTMSSRLSNATPIPEATRPGSIEPLPQTSTLTNEWDYTQITNKKKKIYKSIYMMYGGIYFISVQFFFFFF